jgi:hypothetical protein
LAGGASQMPASTKKCSILRALVSQSPGAWSDEPRSSGHGG